jgi:ABC-type dipeptide/oligopeptide/nickel transport system ATPase subunit
VAIARALVSRPAVLFADEPTGNLDSRRGQEVLDLLLHSVNELGQTIIMVTHDAHAASIADRVLFLKDGLIVHDHGAMRSDDIYDVIRSLEGVCPADELLGNGDPAAAARAATKTREAPTTGDATRETQA